ncbi:MAG TPA: DUF87 domain-containing protein [Candidatus Saccharimonadales bacterium]|nr:DUF87 domain-containing protein [Candidatus Saccharimonadales bacterium]
MAVILVVCFILFLAVSILLKIRFRRYLKNQIVVYLELTPPHLGNKKPEATESLFSVLHNLGNTQSFISRLRKPATVFTLEIVASRKGGIRYIVRLDKDSEDIFRHSLATYLPEVQIKTVEDYFSDQLNLTSAQITQFQQKQHFAYPLKSHDSLDVQDPLSYLTGAMTKLEDNELMVFQVILTPTRPREINAMTQKILSNEDLLADLHNNHVSFFNLLVKGMNKISFAITGLMTEAFHGGSKQSYMYAQAYAHHQQQAMMGLKPARQLTTFEQELIESIHNKLRQSIFRADIRTLVLTNNQFETRQRIKGIEAALASFSVPKYQSLVIRRKALLSRGDNRVSSFTTRMPELRKKRSSLLSVSEVANLYHFPNAQTNKTENMVKSLSKALPAPLSLKDGSKLDISLGENLYHGSTTTIGLTANERQRHLYIIGGTGNGKTTMLLYGIVQDIKSGKGIAIVDPHGDLAESILRHIPENRLDDVIYLNPDDLSYPIGINLLELTPGISGDDLLREKDLVTESVISVMRKMFSDDDSGGHRIEYILRNSIQTALTIEGATLFTIFDLLNDTKYRRGIVAGLEDKDLKNFWNNEINKAGDFQKVKMAAGITAKIGRFLFSASAKRILEQPKSTIDFDEILSSGKILVCNFSKGLLGEDTSTLFGTTVLAKLQMAALRRARLEQFDRQPFYLYVDEFQNFATMAFVQMLSEARKYKLFLTMAEQSTSQQDQQRLVDIILANVGTVICFRSGSPADERQVLPLFTPYIEQGEIANLPAFHFYARIAALNAQEPMSGTTVLLKSDGDRSIARRAIEASRINNAIKYEEPKLDDEPLVKKTKTVVKKQKKEPQTNNTAVAVVPRA